MAQDYLKPKTMSQDFSKRHMKDGGGLFRNPPTYTELGGFTSQSKYGEKNEMSLERGGPSSVKGKPI